MDSKRLDLAAMVPGIWLASLVLFVLYTVASPILFLVSLFSSATSASVARAIINIIIGGGLA